MIIHTIGVLTRSVTAIAARVGDLTTSAFFATGSKTSSCDRLVTPSLISTEFPSVLSPVNLNSFFSPGGMFPISSGLLKMFDCLFLHLLVYYMEHFQYS